MLDAGSMRDNTPAESLSSQTDPAPVATLTSPLGSATPVGISASTLLLATSTLTSVPALQFTTHSAPKSTAIPPHGSAMGTEATGRFWPAASRSTRPWLVTHAWSPSRARKSAYPGTRIV